MAKIHIAISTTTPTLEIQAQALAQQLHLPLAMNNTQDFDYLLILTPEYLGLQKTGSKLLPLYVDFLAGKMQYRRQHTHFRHELLARALGLKSATNPRIIDATAGLARDSFTLACLGFEIQLLERSPIIYALLQDGIRRALTDPIVAPIINRLQLTQTDAIRWLKKLTATERPEIIYLDPMFPERVKSALVKKEMRILHDIIGDDTDAHLLLKTALACATKRVVVKRPRLANPLADTAPTLTMKGSSSRFDIYLL